MSNQIKVYHYKNWRTLGRTYFKPPFKVSDTLINEARIVHVVRGHSQLFAANQSTVLRSGDTFIMKSDNFINHWLPNETDELNEVIVFELTSDLLKDIYQYQLPDWYSATQTNQVFAIQKVASQPLVDSFYSLLRDYLDQHLVLTEDLIKIKAQELLHILIKTDTTDSIRQIFGALFKPGEYEFQEVIQSHLFDGLNSQDLAFLTGQSLSSFKRKFASVYGTTPNKYFISKRLEKAQLLLKTTDMRISEIAYDCGFSDLGYFSKTFQKYFDCSPTEFRDKLLS